MKHTVDGGHAATVAMYETLVKVGDSLYQLASPDLGTTVPLLKSR